LPKEAAERDPIEKELANYWYLRIEYAKALRLGKEKKDKDDPNLKEANRILDNLIKHRHGRFLLQAQMEQNFIFMDLDLYGVSIKKWGDFMKSIPQKVLAEDPKIKRIYFEGYYHNAYCWYKYSQTEPVVKAGKDKQYLTAAARQIVRLETAQNPEGWQLVGDMFRRLLDAEPKLKEEYENLKKAKT
jgi:hypothetical protein